MDTSTEYAVRPIGWVHSSLKSRTGAPRQTYEGAPGARLEILPDFAQGLDGIAAGQDVLVLTCLHEAVRDVLEVHPRGVLPLTGVFATRSPDRPNPVGLHRVRVLSVEGARWIHVDALEAIDGTPIIDIKPVLDRSNDA